MIRGGDGVEELGSDTLVEAEQVEREGVFEAEAAGELSKVGRTGDRRRIGVELAHKLDGVHAHVRVGTEHVQRQIPTGGAGGGAGCSCRPVHSLTL